MQFGAQRALRVSSFRRGFGREGAGRVAGLGLRWPWDTGFGGGFAKVGGLCRCCFVLGTWGVGRRDGVGEGLGCVMVWVEMECWGREVRGVGGGVW